MKKFLYPLPEFDEILAVAYLKKNLKRGAKDINVLHNIKKVLTNEACQKSRGIAK